MKPNFSIFSENLDYALGWMVIHSLWQATLIAFISGIVLLILRKKAAKLRYLISNIALMSVLAAAIVTFCLYYDFSYDEGTLTFIPTTPSVENAYAGTVEEAANLTIAEAIKQQADNATIQHPLSIDVFKDYFNRNLPLILVIWILGVALFMLRLLGGLSYIYYLKNRLNFPDDEYWVALIEDLSNRAGLKKGVELVESAMVRTPMVVGHLKPLILFPMGILNRLSTEEVEAILAHELAHVLRNDYVFNILQSVVEALFYFNPAVWWLSSQIRNERESACDDIAINLIQNKMNYARALVTIQEMAYFPMTPALAFAGQRKSQFLMRMQRILNQPNNKSNVMEKLTATCLLIFLMIGLSFGSNLKGNNLDNKTNLTPSVFSALDTVPSNDFYSNIPKDGDYNYEDNTQKVKMNIAEGKVKQLIINGLDVPEKDIPNFDNLTQKIIRKNAPAQPLLNTPEGLAQFQGNQPSFNFDSMNDLIKQNGQSFNFNNELNMLELQKDNQNFNFDSQSDIYDLLKKNDQNSNFDLQNDIQSLIKKNQKGEFTLDNLAQKFDLDKMGGADLDYSEDGNGDMIIKGKDGSRTVIENNEKGEQVVTTTQRNGDMCKIISDSKGNTITENYEGRKLKNKTHISATENGGTAISTYENGKTTKTYINGDEITTVNADGSKSVIETDKQGNTIIKNYDKTGNLIEELKVIGNKTYLNGREMTKEEMRARNIMGSKDAYGEHRFKDDNGNSYNRFGQIQENQAKRNPINTTTNSDGDCNCDVEDIEDLRDKTEDLLEDLRDLLGDVKLKPTEYLNANALRSEVSNFKSTLKKELSDKDLKSSIREYQRLKKRGDKLKDDCNCPDARGNISPNKSNGYAYSYSGAGDSPTKSAIGAELRKDGFLSEGPLTFIIRQNEIQLDYQDGNQEETFIKGKNFKKYAEIYERTSGKKLRGDTDQRFNFNTSGQGSTRIATSPNSYSYGYGDSKVEAERARKDAERRSKGQSKEDDKSIKAFRSIYLNLNEMGLITLNKKITIEVNKNSISVDGKKVDDASFKRIMRDFEAKLGKKVAQLSIYFKGVVTRISEDNVEMNGTNSHSLNTDD